jgi:hypothetical protein
MKHTIPIAKTMVLLVGFLASVGCGISAANLMATAVPPTLTAIAATQRVALMSSHGRYVTAKGGGGGWSLRQEPDLTDCGWFTLRHLDNGKVALITCHGRYVTAPESGTTRADWLLWQESELHECGQFVLHDLGGDGIAFETCAERYFTAGDGGWEPELEWSVVAKTNVLQAWERFTVLQAYIPLSPVIADFDRCKGVTNRGGQMGPVYEPKSDDTIVVSYVQEAGRGCIARLEYDIVGWSAFWMQLQGADLSPYSQLVFDVKADPQNVPERVKIELKRAGGQEVSILYISGITTDWQTMRVNLRDFGGSLSSFTDIEELVFTFVADESGKTGVIYLDNIALRRAWGNQ